MELKELIERRRSLNVDLAVHEASVAFFWAAPNPWFEISRSDTDCADEPEPVTTPPRHFTSTASCLESLADLQPGLEGGFPSRDDSKWSGLAEDFAQRVIRADPSAWTSDEAAHVYCRVRTLPAVIRLAPTLNGADGLAVQARLEEAFRAIEVTGSHPKDRGLREASVSAMGQANSDPAYPPNAFHSYWGSKSYRRYMRRLRERQDLPNLKPDVQDLVRQNQAWAHAAIGKQIAFLSAGQARGDAHQLAYAILADLLANDRSIAPASAQFDLYESGLSAFFAAQDGSGRWPQSAPLFHYPHSGNAYCYGYETLTELLRPALPRQEGLAYRSMLEPYLPQLFLAWEQAMRSRVPLDQEQGDIFGWSSMHHATRTSPEAWATAEVFSFGQMLRCVSGHFASAGAGRALNARRPSYASREKAREALADRGRTWAPDSWTVGRRLAALFLHPQASHQSASSDPAIRDPDVSTIGSDDARSAVLFGPPGTGKTTIVEALAGALGWEYVEVLAADFLNEGVDAVPARADHLFELLMQLDRCVVLFDEIDELIRDRSEERTDPFGRFLTTSMLPKIAKLWKQRRVLFFVATNHVSKADPAITRSSRFDARILVPPPGLEVKQRILDEHLRDLAPRIERDEVIAAMSPNEADRNGLPREKEALAVLPLLRYDQMPELARALESQGKEGLYAALDAMAINLASREWQPASGRHDGSEPIPQLRAVYAEYRGDESHDFSRRQVARLRDAGESGRDKWVDVPDDLDAVYTVRKDGDLGSGAARDRGLLDFSSG